MTRARIEFLGAALAALGALGSTACSGKSCAPPPCPAPGNFDPSTCECVSGALRTNGGAAGGGGAGGIGSGGASNECVQGRSNYLQFSQTQLAQNSSCVVDSDCVAVNETNACSDNGCGSFIVLAASAPASVLSALHDYASDNCATCPPLAPELCIRMNSGVSCVSGACTFVAATSN
jgi:hypothetical protein